MGGDALSKKQKQILQDIVNANYDYFLTIPRLNKEAAEEVVQKSLFYIVQKMDNKLKGKTDRYIKGYIISAIKSRTKNYIRDNSKMIKLSNDQIEFFEEEGKLREFGSYRKSSNREQ